MKRDIFMGLNNVMAFLTLRRSHVFLYILFFLPAFYVLHACNAYFKLISTKDAFSCLLEYLLFSLVVILISLFLFLSIRKSFLFSFFILYIFLFFGSVMDFIKNLPISSFFYSYLFLLPSIAALVFGAFMVLKKSGRTFVKSVKVVSIFIVVSFAIDVCVYLFYTVSGKEKENLLFSSDKTDYKLNVPSADSLPDIFFLVMDSYTSTYALRELFDFDNSGMDSLFGKNDFFLLNQSSSNYNTTPLSLAATFNLNYLDTEVETNVMTNKLLVRGIATLKSAGLFPFLKKCGYEYYNFGAFSVGGEDPQKATFFADLPKYAISLHTLWGRVRRDIYWSFTTKNVFTGTFKIPQSYYERKDYILKLNQLNYDLFLKELRKPSYGNPRFIYSHLILPHGPYYFDSIGRFNSDTLIFKKKIDSKKGYVGQLQYANSLIRNLLENIPSDQNRPKVVVIQGDHGSRVKGDNLWLTDFSCLNAFYFSDKNYASLYDSMTSVNIFRVVLNKYFNQDFPLLKDRINNKMKVELQ